MDINGISIAIATKGRVNLLEALLESIAKARKNYKKNCEVILVDDSNETDVILIEALCRKWDAKRCDYSPSVAGKRNYGAKMAQYEIVLFLDSDCIATEHILEEHEKKYTDERIGGVAGPLEFIGEENWYWQSVNTSPYVICFQMPRWGETSVWAATANFSVRKDVFLEIGGFDETFPNKPGGEDVDLGLRMTKRGYKIVNTVEGLVYHDKKTWMDRKAMFNRCWNYGRADVYLVERHEDYSTFMPPRKTILNIIMILTCLLFTIILDWKCVVLIPAFLLSDVVVDALLAQKYAYGNNDFLHQMATQQLSRINEYGYLWECLTRKNFRNMFRQTVFFEEQMKFVPHNGMIRGLQFLFEYLLLIWVAFLF